MDRFTNAELTDIHFIYGLADGNVRAAARLYRKDIQRGANQIIKRQLGYIRMIWLVPTTEQQRAHFRQLGRQRSGCPSTRHL